MISSDMISSESTRNFVSKKVNPHRSFSDYYLLSGDFVVEQKIVLLIINYLVILWSQNRKIDYMEKKIH